MLPRHAEVRIAQEGLLEHLEVLREKNPDDVDRDQSIALRIFLNLVELVGAQPQR